MNNTRQSSSSGNFSMPDAPPKSISDHDKSMPDYSRPPSLDSSYHSYPEYEHSRPMSPTSSYAPSLSAPFAPQPLSPSGSRRISASAEYLRGPRIRKLSNDAERSLPGPSASRPRLEYALPGPSASRPRSPSGPVPVDPKTGLSLEAATVATWPLDEEEAFRREAFEPSQFVELYESISPRRLTGSGIFAPTNTRVSSAANTPPAAPRPSAAAEARALSYGGKDRTVSNATRDLPPATLSRAITEPEPKLKARVTSRKSDSRQSKIRDEPSPKPQKIVKKTPSLSVKGRKENRTSEIGLEESTESQRKTSTTSVALQNKENIDALHPSGGDSKRRRVSNPFDTDTALAAETIVQTSPRKTSFNAESKGVSPNKMNEIDELTAEGIITRTPFGHLENM